MCIKNTALSSPCLKAGASRAESVIFIVGIGLVAEIFSLFMLVKEIL
ncbi:hypothetical protein HMI48_10065 [Acidithiobacillus ferrooxidans]|nr:hypothetical protein [Acidithiobacillus ferrooxidans]MBU2774208.1 hypothetical protein [Acidithiobacillus ferrooxidans]